MKLFSDAIQIDRVNAYLHYQSCAGKRIGRLRLAGIQIVVTNPFLADHPRFVAILAIFYAVLGQILRSNYRQAQAAIVEYNKSILLNELVERKVVKFESGNDCPLALLAEKWLLGKKQKRGEAFFEPKADKFDSILHYKNVAAHAAELEKLLPDSDLKSTLKQITKSNPLEKTHFKQLKESLKRLSHLAVGVKSLKSSQKQRFKAVLNSLHGSKDFSSLIDLHHRLEHIAYIEEVSDDDLIKALSDGRSEAAILPDLKAKAARAHRQACLRRIIELTAKAPFGRQLVNLMDVHTGFEDNRAVMNLIKALEELSNPELPEGMRLDEAVIVESFLNNWRWESFQKNSLDESADFLDHLDQQVSRLLIEMRKRQYDQLHLLALKCAGERFASDFKKYCPQDLNEDLKPVLGSSFGLKDDFEKIYHVFKNKAIKSFQITPEEFEECFFAEKLRLAFDRFRQLGLERPSAEICPEFYAWLCDLAALRSEVLCPAGVIEQLRSVFKPFQDNNISFSVMLTNHLLEEVVKAGHIEQVIAWQPALKELIRLAGEVDEGFLRFTPEIITKVALQFALNQGFPHDVIRFSSVIARKEAVLAHLRAFCQKESLSVEYESILREKWRAAYRKEVMKSIQDLKPFEGQFEAQFFRGGVDPIVLKLLWQASKAGSQLSYELGLNPEFIAEGYAEFFQSCTKNGKKLRMPSSLELAAFCHRLPALKEWQKRLEIKLAHLQKQTLKLFISAFQDENLNWRWAPRFDQELEATAKLLQDAIRSYEAEGNLNSLSAYQSLANGCVDHLVKLRRQSLALDQIPLDFLSLYYADLPEIDGWKSNLKSPLELQVLQELEKRGLKGPVSPRECHLLAKYLAMGAKITLEGNYSNSVVALAIIRLLQGFRHANRTFTDISEEALMRFCFESFIESSIPFACAGDSKALIHLFGFITHKEIPLNTTGKNCLKLLIEAITSSSFCGGRNLSHPRLAAKFPELLGALGLGSVDQLNNYPLSDLLKEIFTSQADYLFTQVNLGQLLEALGNNPAHILALIEKLLGDLIGAATFEPLRPFIKLLVGEKINQASVEAFLAVARAIPEAGGVDFTLKISTEKVINAVIEAIKEAKKGGDHPLSFVDRSIHFGADQLISAQQNRTKAFKEQVLPLLVEWLNGLKTLNLKRELFNELVSSASALISLAFRALKHPAGKQLLKKPLDLLLDVWRSPEALPDKEHLVELLYQVLFEALQAVPRMAPNFFNDLINEIHSITRMKGVLTQDPPCDKTAEEQPFLLNSETGCLDQNWLQQNIEYFEKKAKSAFEINFFDALHIKAQKSRVQESGLIDKFIKEFIPVFSHRSIDNHQLDKALELICLADLLIAEEHQTIEVAVQACRRYCQSFIGSNRQLVIPSETISDRIESFFSSCPVKRAQACILPFALDSTVELLTLNLVDQRKLDNLAAKSTLQRKIFFHLNHQNFEDTHAPLNKCGLEALSQIVKAFIELDFILSKGVLHPALVAERRAILHALGLRSILLLNKVEDPSWISKSVIKEAVLRTNEINLGCLKDSFRKNSIVCLTEICWPLVDNLMLDSSPVERDLAKRAISDLANELSGKKIVTRFFESVGRPLENWHFLDGVELRVNLSIQQIVEGTKQTLARYNALPESKPPDLSCGLLPWLIECFIKLITEAQQQRSNLRLNHHFQTSKTAALASQWLDLIEEKIGPAMRFTETMTRAFSTEENQNGASKAIAFIAFLLNQDLVKVVLKACLEITLLLERDEVSDEIKMVKKGIESFKIEFNSDSPKGEGRDQNLLNGLESLEERLGVINLLQSRLDQIVWVVNSMIKSIFNRHDLSLHKNLISDFITIITEPESDVDKIRLRQHIVESALIILEEIPKFLIEI